MARKAKFKKDEQVVLSCGLLMNVTRDQYEYRGKQVVDVKDLEEERKRVPVSEVNRLPETLTGAILQPVSEKVVVSESSPLVSDTINTFGEIPLGKYERIIKNKYDRRSMVIDVYDVLEAFSVTDPALQHLIKKALAPGQRGHKSIEADLKDINASSIRAIELHENRTN